MFTPFEQFEVKGLFVSNSIGVFIIILLSLVMLNSGGYKSKLIGNRYTVVLSRINWLVYSLVERSIHGVSLSLFMIIISLNLIGLVSYSYTVTSQIVLTMCLSLGVWLGKLYVGLEKYGRNVLRLLIPSGISFGMVGFFVFVELIGFITPIISLSVRLFANMLSGHVLLKVLFGFTWLMLIEGGVFEIVHVISLGILLCLYGLELGVAMVQAYVFVLLSGIYFKDIKYISH